MGLAANLDLATSRALTDFRQYINSDLVFSDLKFQPLCSEIAAVEVVIPSGLEQKLPLATTWSLFLAIPSEKTLTLATSIGFSDLEPFDGG